ncbi:helix-turn-helix domain-containing protein [Paenibacillus sp. MBLB4367]|uniref:helix-turn-helix domain-containing protein n=1 Tax=Paenibacillus sp. MBLB4367 TaxID=3384767 RepID=UPI00390829AB
MIRRKKSVFLTLWLSYIVILIIPVVISAVLYTGMENAMVGNANRSNIAMLEQVRQVVDSRMEEIDQLTVQIATHPKLQTLWNISEGEKYVQYAEAVKALKNVQSGSGFIEDFYIHLAEPDIILTPNLKTDTTTYYTKLFQYPEKGIDQLRKDLFSSYHFKSFWPVTTILDGPFSTRALLCAVSLPFGESDNVRATLVVLVDEQQIFDLLKQIEWVNSGSMYILDNAGHVMVSTAERNELPAGLGDKINGSSGSESYRLDGQMEMLSYTTGESGWKYVSLVPKDVVLKRVNEIKGWAVTLLVLGIIGGAIAAYWMAYRSYSPIRDMMMTILGGKTGNVPAATNEYEFIKSSISETMEEGRALKQRLEGHMPVVRTHFLTRMLKGQAEPAALERSSLEFMGVRFPSDSVCVLLIEVDDTSQFMLEDNERDWALIRFILFNLSSELIGERGYVAETDLNRLAILWNPPDDSEASREQRGRFISELKQVVEERFRLQITVASSSIRQGLSETGRCYAEAINALDYRIIHGINKVIYFEEIKEMDRSFYYYPTETEVQLMNLVKSGDYENAARLLDELYEQNVVSRGLTPEMGKCLFFDLLSTMLKVMNALKIDGKQLFEGAADPIKHILGSRSAEGMLRKIKELCAYICESVRDARSEQNERLNDRLKVYIVQNCADNGLSLTSIADHFGMTPQYVSGFFKKQNGINLTDYLVDVRIREAKRLLAETELTVLQVAQSVGYATDIGFIRVFKKQEGITPGKYREMALQAGEEKNG